MNLENGKTKIAIADDHAMFRKGISKLLDPDRYEIVFDVENGEALIKKIKETSTVLPEIIIMDINMPVMNGYITISWLNEHFPEIKVLVVSMIDNEDAILRLLKLRVKGFLSKEMEPEDLYSALSSITQRGYYYTDFVTNKLIHSIQQNEENCSDSKSSSTDSIWNQLNQNQKEFVRLACSDMTYDCIADKMHVSPKTVDGYREAVFAKFNVKNRVALVIFAIKNGLVTL